MKMKFTFGMLLAFGATSLFAQTSEMQGTVNLGPKATIFKVVTVPDCPQSYTPPTGSAGTSVTHETKFTNNKTEITVKDIVSPADSVITIKANQMLKIAMSPHSKGKANLYIDEKDKSVLYVNYWLNPANKVESGITIQEFYPVFPCTPGTPTMDSIAKRKLTSDEIFRRVPVHPNSSETTTPWFLNSDHIKVYKPDGALDYYLVNRYDRNAKYILELQNRESLPYNSASLELAALTIPFKYRFGFKKNGIDIRDDVTASFNVGVYGGYKLTKYSVINKEGTYINRNHASVRFGPFINISTTTLDSVSTTVGKVPMKGDDKHNIAIFSTGMGLMGELKGVQIGIYGGSDFGVGSASGNWNYHKKFWLGVGLGYKITDLFAKKE